MSKHYPLSAASKEFNLINDLYPDLQERLAQYPQLNTYDEFAKELGSEMLSRWMRKYRRSVSDVLKTVESDSTFVSTDDLPWIARWQNCKHVYRIDSNVAEVLKDQPLDDNLPIDVLLHFPYPIVYIDAKVQALANDALVDAKGFFAYLDHGDNGLVELELIYLLNSGGRSRRAFPLEKGLSFKQGIERISAFDKKVSLENQQAFEKGLSDIEFLQPDDPNVVRAFTGSLSSALNLLLFTLSAENDPQVIYAPSRHIAKQKVGAKTNLETVTLLGAKIGHAIGEAKRYERDNRVISNSDSKLSRSMAPHVRIAHWHHYWVGKRKDRSDGQFGDELVLKWIPPIPINIGNGEVIEMVHQQLSDKSLASKVPSTTVAAEKLSRIKESMPAKKEIRQK